MNAAGYNDFTGSLPSEIGLLGVVVLEKHLLTFMLLRARSSFTMVTQAVGLNVILIIAIRIMLDIATCR